MRQERFFIASSLALVLSLGSAAYCATVNGVIKAVNGKPVSGVRVAIEANHAGAAETISNPDGTYKIESLAPGRYTIRLDPLKSGFAAGDAVATIGKEGLTVDWIVSVNTPALAVATPLVPSAVPGVGFWGRNGGVIGAMDTSNTLSRVEE